MWRTGKCLKNGTNQTCHLYCKNNLSSKKRFSHFRGYPVIFFLFIICGLQLEKTLQQILNFIYSKVFYGTVADDTLLHYYDAAISDKNLKNYCFITF